MSSGKAPGYDELPAEVFKAGGPVLTDKMVTLFGMMWEKRAVPQDFKDALIVHIFKRKGDLFATITGAFHCYPYPAKYWHGSS